MEHTHNSARLVVGCMTGTSIDCIDIALVQIEGNGLRMKSSILRTSSRSLSGLAEPLRRLSLQQSMTAGEITRLASELGALHFELIKEITIDQQIDLIAVHGQTVFHAPPLSWQLINPSLIAYNLGIPVVYDLRTADLALGGQGAPITPLADFIMFRSPEERRTVVNLGGFCNITQLPACPNMELDRFVSQIRGSDVCVCNQLLDAIARELLGKPCDENGDEAMRGAIQEEPYIRLIELLQNQSQEARSLGTGDELNDWLAAYRNSHSKCDLARTACGTIAQTIVSACSDADRLILAGGGVHNRALVQEIMAKSGNPVDMSDSYGVPAQYREAAAMAVLGAICRDRVPITLPQVTGVKTPPVSGCWVLP